MIFDSTTSAEALDLYVESIAFDNAALARSSGLRVFVSGCPNSCAQHQAGDIGLAGSSPVALSFRFRGRRAGIA